MKRFFVLILLLASFTSFATELQIHYNKDKDPESFFGTGQYTLTLDHFAPTDWGYVFFFMDAYSKKDSVPQTDMVYYEAHLGLSFNKMFGFEQKGFIKDVYFHVELDDSGASYINARKLYGFDFDIDCGFFPVLQFQTLYSDESNKDSGHYQFTLVWFKPFKIGSQDFYFRGFADYWETDDGMGNDYQVFLCQPQIVWKASKHLLIGTELEFSNNFYMAPDDQSYFNASIFISIPF